MLGCTQGWAGSPSLHTGRERHPLRAWPASLANTTKGFPWEQLFRSNPYIIQIPAKAWVAENPWIVRACQNMRCLKENKNGEVFYLQKNVATLYSYRNNPGGITTGKQGGKSFTVRLHFFGGNELHITHMPDQNSGLYMKHFFFFFSITYCSTQCGRMNPRRWIRTMANFLVGLLKMKFPSPISGIINVWALKGFGTSPL